ncbi:MAG: rhodanese-like domain-containing protein, partial [Rhodopila sp.]
MLIETALTGSRRLTAARAAVPAITPTDAADLVTKSDALVVDVRDGTEVAASGKVKGALAVSRGLLEFKAD